MSSQPTHPEIPPTEMQTAPIQVPANQIEAVPKFYRAEDGSLQPIPPGMMEARAAAIEAHRKLVEAGRFRESRVYADPSPEEFNAFPINPKYVLAHDGWTKDRMMTEYALAREIRQKTGLPEEWEPDERKIRWHKEQLARLEKADAAPRCEHIYADGTRCRGPRLKSGRECYAHTRMKKTATRSLALMPVEDANAVVVNIMEIHRAMCDDEITERRAGLLLYGHQLALTALNKVSFRETDPHEMVTEMEASGDPVIGGSGDRIVEPSDHREHEISGDLVIGGSGDRKKEAATLESGDFPDHEEIEEVEISGDLVIGGSGDREQEQKALASGAELKAAEGDAGHKTSGDEGDAGRGMECAKSNEFGDEGDGMGGGRVSGDREIGSSGHQDIGTSEHRNIGTSEHRNIGTSEHRTTSFNGDEEDCGRSSANIAETRGGV